MVGLPARLDRGSLPRRPDTPDRSVGHRTVTPVPSNPHEALIQMFRHRPELAAELLTVAFGLSLPDYDHARLGSGELTPIEHRADTVVELRTGKTSVLAVVVEVQLSRDPAKRFSWPVYQAVVRARLRCPTTLLVICPEAATAAWCASTIQLGPNRARAKADPADDRSLPGGPQSGTGRAFGDGTRRPQRPG
jgi:hypothetical protein